MTRAIALIAVLAGVARADTTVEDPAREANLESKAPRQGVTVSLALGPGLVLGSGISDRVPAASFRLGHVATERTVVFVELVGGTFVHTLVGKTLFDSEGGLFVGGLYYVNPSVWIRGGGGLTVHTLDTGTASGKQAMPGPGGVFGVGVDLLRRHFFVLGLEAFVVGGIDGGQLATVSAFGVGASYY